MAHESSGKTTCVLHAIAGGANGVVAVSAHSADAELAVGPSVCVQALGVGLGEAVGIATRFGRTGIGNSARCSRAVAAVDLIVVDSVAAPGASRRDRRGMEDAHTGLQALVDVSGASCKLDLGHGAEDRLRRILLLNLHLVQKIGVVSGNPEATTRGKCVERRVHASGSSDANLEPIKKGDGVVGNRARTRR